MGPRMLKIISFFKESTGIKYTKGITLFILRGITPPKVDNKLKVQKTNGEIF